MKVLATTASDDKTSALTLVLQSADEIFFLRCLAEYYAGNSDVDGDNQITDVELFAKNLSRALPSANGIMPAEAAEIVQKEENIPLSQFDQENSTFTIGSDGQPYWTIAIGHIDAREFARREENEGWSEKFDGGYENATEEQLAQYAQGLRHGLITMDFENNTIQVHPEGTEKTENMTEATITQW